MMIEKIYIKPQLQAFKKLCKRPKRDSQELDQIISEVFNLVQSEGDAGVRKVTEKYDGVLIENIKVNESEVQQSIDAISLSLKTAIRLAKENIKTFHAAQVNEDLVVETMNGVKCLQKTVGIEKVGIYVPGGTAPLFSTVLMLAIPAMIAGCKEIILCTPPNAKGKIHPAILYTAQLCGIKQIYKVGGAQAIAAMTIGTESIPSVSKLFGPGNQYVTAAKQYAQKYGVAMDSPAGPSELLVYADQTAVPEFVAADLLSQAEHGIDSQVILVADSEEVLAKVNGHLERQVALLPRKEIASAALKNSKVIVLNEVDNAFQFINEYGPEHLIIASENYEEYVCKVINAGSVFLGNYCPESAGDYASGTNHTLPTDGWAKSYNGVNVDSFSRKITFQEISKVGIQNLGHTVIEMARNEELEAHALAVEVRLSQLKNEEK